MSGRRIDIRTLGKRVSEAYGIPINELRSGGRRNVVVEARHATSWISVRELGYSGTDVARYLGVTNSCVTRIIASGRKPDLKNIKFK